MKGKNKNKRKVGKIILLAMSFVMTAVLTFTITLAWFYDSDWASNSVTMAGSVGIELKDKINGKIDSGALHFIINGDKAYPGQGIEVKASVFNNGGISASGVTAEELATANKGSACYIRAFFAVYTDIGMNTGYEGTAEDDPDQKMNSTYLYEFLEDLIDDINNKEGATYKWIYYKNNDPHMALNGEYWFEGVKATTKDATKVDAGYFYLCNTDGSTLQSLSVGSEAAFLWDGSFVIPWQLTNVSADKKIFVGVQFQAIQTFIPKMNNGQIISSKDNQLPANECTYDATEVQTVFNSCYFTPMKYIVDGVDYKGSGFTGTTQPSST